MKQRFKLEIEDFIVKYKFKKKIKYYCMTYNLMSCDLGALPINYSNRWQMKKFVSKTTEREIVLKTMKQMSL